MAVSDVVAHDGLTTDKHVATACQVHMCVITGKPLPIPVPTSSGGHSPAVAAMPDIAEYQKVGGTLLQSRPSVEIQLTPLGPVSLVKAHSQAADMQCSLLTIV